MNQPAPFIAPSFGAFAAPPAPPAAQPVFAAPAPPAFAAPPAPVPAPAAVDPQTQQLIGLVVRNARINGQPLSSNEQIQRVIDSVTRSLQGYPSNKPMVERLIGVFNSPQPLLFDSSYQIAPQPLSQTNIEPGPALPATPEQINLAIIDLMPTKAVWQGNAIPAQSAQQAASYMLTLPEFQGQQPGSILAWLQSLTQPYELDAASRKPVTAAPANPVSDQTGAQVAQPAAPVLPPPAAAAGAAPEATEAGDEGGPGLIDPVDGTKCKNLRGLKTRVTRTHKMDWAQFCAQHSLDASTGLPKGPQPIGQPAAVPTTPPPTGPALTSLLGTPAAQPVSTAPAPAAQPVVFAQPAPAPQAMPTPPAQVQAQPIVGFSPPSAPAPVAFQPNPPAMPAGTLMPQHQAVAPAPVQAAAHGSLRVEAARMLGGEVSLLIVSVLDLPGIKLPEGARDLNQLAHEAEAQARREMTVVDLADAAYSKGKQAAQRAFGQLLTQWPKTYVLKNGYDLILPDGYLAIVLARVTSLMLVQDKGQMTVVTL